MKLLKTDEVAKILRVSEEYVRILARDNIIRSYKEGRKGGYRFIESDIQNYIIMKHEELN